VPIARGVVEHFGGGGFGELDGLRAAEEVVEEIGDHQEGLGGFEPGVARKHHGVELEEGVELERLHAGGGVEIGFGDALEEALRDAVGARVAVVRGIVEQATAAVEEGEVNAPGVDGDAGGRFGEARAELDEAVLNLRPDAQRVPVEAAVQADAGVGKRCSSSSEKRRPSQWPTIKRPLDAPRSTATKCDIVPQGLKPH